MRLFGGIFAALSVSALLFQAFAENVGSTTGPGLQVEKRRYAVITANGRGHMGYAIGYYFQQIEEAKAAALKGCSQSDCRIVMQPTLTSCIAFADSHAGGGYWYWFSTAETQRDAANLVWGWCTENEGARPGCKIQFEVCQ